MHNVLGEYGDVVVDYIDKQTQDMPQLSLLSKIVLRDLIQYGFTYDDKIHELIWYYASKYPHEGNEQELDAEQELKNLKQWLESEQS